MPAERERVFDLIHDYDRRLEWDTMLRSARLEADAPGVGTVAVCTARRILGGYSFRTRYVTFNRPAVAAIKLESSPPFFAMWDASIRYEPSENGASKATYTMTFRCKPAWAAWALEPVAKALFRRETRRRLAALAKALRAKSHPGDQDPRNAESRS